MSSTQNDATRLLQVIEGMVQKTTKSGANIDVTYGQVFSLSGSEASVYLAGSRELAASDGGTPEPSGGFRVPTWMRLHAGDYVRVAMDSRGHRWIEEYLPIPASTDVNPSTAIPGGDLSLWSGIIPGDGGSVVQVSGFPRVAVDFAGGQILFGSGSAPSDATAGRTDNGTIAITKLALPTVATQTLIAGSRVLANSTTIQITTDSDVVSTVTPAIAPGTDGQIIVLIYTGAFSWELISGVSSNVILTTVSYVMEDLNNLTLMWNSSTGRWLEIGRGLGVGVASTATASHVAATDPHTGYVLESLLDAKGDLIVATAADVPSKLPVSGVNGRVLTEDSAEATGMKWSAASGGIPPTIIDAKGDLIAGSAADTAARLAVSGVNGRVLSEDSAEATGLKWIAPPSSGIPATILDAKGDLIVATAADTAARLALSGINGRVLTEDSAEASGMKWAPSDAASVLDTQGDFLWMPMTNVTVLTRSGGGPLGGGYTIDTVTFAATPGKTYRITLTGWGGGTLNMGVEWDPGSTADAWYTGPTRDFVAPAGITTGQLAGRDNGGSLSWTSYIVEEVNPAVLDDFASGTVGRAVLASATAATARTNLGLVIGTDVQAYDSDIPTVSASQAEMEAGTETGLRAMSPQRVAQAIALRAGGGGGTGYLDAALVALGSDQSTSSSTPVVVHTDLAVTFVVPSSGEVLVEMTGMFSAASGYNFYWVVLEGSTNIGEVTVWSSGSTPETAGRVTTVRRLITGLTPGAVKTYKFAHRTNGGGTTTVLSLSPTLITVAAVGAAGGGGASWTQKVTESGTSFANFTGLSGTWASDGTTINQTNNSESFKTAKYNTMLPLGFGCIFESEIRLPTSGQGAGSFIYGALIVGSIGVILNTGSSGDNIHHQDWGVTDLRTIAFTVNLDTWYKLRVVANGSWVSVYVDGILISTTNVPSAAAADYLNLGSYGSVVNFRNIKAWILGDETTGGSCPVGDASVRFYGHDDGSSASVGTWGYVATTTSPIYGAQLWGNNTGAQNDAMTWTRFFQAGTYTIQIRGVTNTDKPIVTVKVDGVTVGTVDYYAGGLAHLRTTVTGVVLAAGGIHTIQVVMATKHASSSGYYMAFSDIMMYRTA